MTIVSSFVPLWIREKARPDGKSVMDTWRLSPRVSPLDVPLEGRLAVAEAGDCRWAVTPNIPPSTPDSDFDSGSGTVILSKSKSGNGTSTVQQTATCGYPSEDIEANARHEFKAEAEIDDEKYASAIGSKRIIASKVFQGVDSGSQGKSPEIITLQTNLSLSVSGGGLIEDSGEARIVESKVELFVFGTCNGDCRVVTKVINIKDGYWDPPPADRRACGALPLPLRPAAMKTRMALLLVVCSGVVGAWFSVRSAPMPRLTRGSSSALPVGGDAAGARGIARLRLRIEVETSNGPVPAELRVSVAGAIRKIGFRAPATLEVRDLPAGRCAVNL